VIEKKAQLVLKMVDNRIKEILPKAGLVYSEKASLTEVLCKPKILPIKSNTLMKIEKMEQELAQ
jgi:BBSome-interacting protein 1